MKANQVYEKLISDGIIGASGRIEFKLGRVTVKIESRDSVGNMIQAWFENWLLLNFPNSRKNTSTQNFPDFFLNPSQDNIDLLEVKSFDSDRGPGFDIANFDSYSNSLLTQPDRLDSDYLIFSYKMNGSDITITNLWLKKVWELTGPSGTYPLKVQEKKSVIYNIRPITWFSKKSKFLPFSNRLEFIKALNETRYQYPQTKYGNAHWMKTVQAKYLQLTGNDL